MPCNIYWKDKAGRFLGCNKSNWESFQLGSSHGYKGKTDYDILPKEEAVQIRLIDDKVIRTGTPIVTEETASNDRRKIYLSHKIPLKNKYEKIIGILGVSVDVTAAKKEIEDQFDFLEDIIATMPGNVYWIDREGVYLGCNDNQAKAIGLASRKDIVGKRNVDMPGFLIPEALDPINQKVMETGETMIIEEPAVSRDGKQITVLSSKVPIKNKSGDVTGMVGISIDITAEKQAEQLEREKLVAEKQSEVMKMMSSTIAHELRTPQASIDMTCEQLKDAWPILLAGYKAALDMGCNIPILPDDVFEYLREENIGERLMRINNNCRTMVNMMNKNVLQGQLNGKSVQFSPKKVVENTIKDYPYRSSIEERTIKGVFGDDFVAMGDPDLFEHVILNLLKNAIYHVLFNRKGHIEIRLFAESDCNTIYFEDTGPGISPEHVDKIFESFFTKNTDNGTGVGLSLCKNVIENNMHGKIRCESELGKYTRFCLQLPKANDTNQMD